MLPGAKSWKPYWVDIRDNFLDISTEFGKDPFTSYHIGVLKVRPSKEYPDRPDVLEFYDGDGFTATHFFVFTYDPFDILEFFKKVCNAYKTWRQQILESRQTKTYSCDIKPPGFFAGNVTWTVTQANIEISKGNQIQQTIPLSDINTVTPTAIQNKSAQFKFSWKQQSDVAEYRCSSLDNMKKLLDAIYTNRFIEKNPPSQPAAPSPAAEQAPSAEQPAETPANA